MSRSAELFSDRAIRIVAENKIQAAIDAGEFDRLPGLGKPSPLVDEPYDPFWWIRRKLRAEQLNGKLRIADCGLRIADLISANPQSAIRDRVP
jgi:hypothetical protein